MTRSKRAFDLTCCVLALPLLAVTTAIIAAITWLVAPGPVFFRQERVGWRERRFKLYKFRTMQVGADATVHQAHVRELFTSNVPMTKLDARRDSRLIPTGWLLRASGLDELPQVINVLRGEMSLVGPRPCLPEEVQHYRADQRERFSAVPGLTGYWQVCGKNRTTFDQMVQLDIHYARHASLGFDLGIIVRTPAVLLRQITETWRQRRSAGQPAPTTEARQLSLDFGPDHRTKPPRAMPAIIRPSVQAWKERSS